jgi:hypothetical protein
MVRRLKEVELYEGSITLFPMNTEARIESVKSGDVELKPYPNEHACRLNDPGKYERFARMKRKHDGKEYSVIIGFKKGGGSEDQAYRYPKDTWSAAEAKAHCADHDGTFEAAGKELEVRCSSCGETITVKTGEDPDMTLLEDSPNGTPVQDSSSGLEDYAEVLASRIKALKI